MSRPRASTHEVNSLFYKQLRAYEREMMTSALTFCNGSVPDACTVLGISRKTFYNRAQALGGLLGHPLNEPYDSWREQKKKRREAKANEKHPDNGTSVEEQRDVSSEATTSPDGKADGPDVQENGLGDLDSIQLAGEGDEPDDARDAGSVLRDEHR